MESAHLPIWSDFQSSETERIHFVRSTESPIKVFRNSRTPTRTKTGLRIGFSTSKNSSVERISCKGRVQIPKIVRAIHQIRSFNTPENLSTRRKQPPIQVYCKDRPVPANFFLDKPCYN